MTSTTRSRRSNDARVRSQEGRDGEERVRSPRGKREEKREKPEERDQHDQDERVKGRNGSVPNEAGWYRKCSVPDGSVQNEQGWYRKCSVPKREQGREQRNERREKREERREKMAASLTHCISTVSRGHLEIVLKISRCHRNDRQLDSLHFYSAP